jgi:hypothetical protein
MILVMAIYFKKQLRLPYLALSALILITIVSESLSTISASQIKSNSAIFHLFSAIEFMVVSLVYWLLFKKELYKQIAFIVVFIFLGFVITNAIYLQPINQAPFNNNTLASIIFVTYSFLLFGEMINLEIDTSLFLQPVFWFNSGILIFYTATLIFWGIYHIIQLSASNSILHKAMWVLNLVFYAFIGVSIYLDGKKSPS